MNNIQGFVQERINRMSAPTRWLFVNMAGCILGVGLGVFVMSGISWALSHILSIRSCSGIPCSENVVVAVVISGVVGGAAGGTSGYGIAQLLLRRSMNKRQLLRYALVGTVLWPIVGVFSVINFAVIYAVLLLPFSPLFYFLSPDSLFFWVHAYTVMLISFVVLPGALLGIVLARLRRDGPAYMVDST